MLLDLPYLQGFEVHIETTHWLRSDLYGMFYVVLQRDNSQTKYLQIDSTVATYCADYKGNKTGWFSSLSEVRAAIEKYHTNELATQLQQAIDTIPNKEALQSGEWINSDLTDMSTDSMLHTVSDPEQPIYKFMGKEKDIT